MRFCDLLNLSIKNIKSRWAVLISFCVAISAFCLCFAGTVLLTLRQEKSMPFELILATDGSAGINETTLADVIKIAGVEDVTPVIEIPALINVGGYNAELMLTGVKPSYLQIEIPETSVMPYIILSKAACSLFSKNDSTDTAVSEVPQIEWLNSKSTVTVGDESASVTAKICGIQESEKDEVAAYISLNAAKQILKDTGQAAAYSTVYVRIKDIGYVENVSKSIEALGLSAVNMDVELQTKWAIQTKEMIYLTILSAFCLVFSAVLLFVWQRISLYGQKEAYIMLYWLGVRQKTIMTKILSIQSVLISITGVCVGTLAASVLPLLLSQEITEVSIFIIPIPSIVIAVSAILCMGINIPVWFMKECISAL